MARWCPCHRYVIHDAPLEGETVPDHVLQSLFPAKEFQGKWVVIHRDGYFRSPFLRVTISYGFSLKAPRVG
jgi:hypothetical protein